MCLNTSKLFQVLLSNTNNSISYQSFVYSQLNSFKYCNSTQVILFAKYFYLMPTICVQLYALK